MTKSVYKDIKNLVINDFGLTKELIIEVIEKHAGKAIAAWFDGHKQSLWLQKIITSAVRSTVRNAVCDEVRSRITITATVDERTR